ncbi:MAG: dihydroneopterin aldolase [Mucilaginibacter sp.]|nr:dihydroneopterin aldolase [Mucilaginibacter sp.]
MIVALHGAEFFAYHGFYPEEQKLGCCFIVDIEVEFTPTGDMNGDEISNTVNYEQLHNIACEEMKLTKKLIETVAEAIMNRIKDQYNLVDSIKLTVMKKNPPLSTKVAYSAVSLHYQKG